MSINPESVGDPSEDANRYLQDANTEESEEQAGREGPGDDVRIGPDQSDQPQAGAAEPTD
nr:hypothetical protein [uncultured Actinoplanes sp.]